VLQHLDTTHRPIPRQAELRLANRWLATPSILATSVYTLVASSLIASRTRDADRRCRGHRGQATTEYALVLLAAALVALMVVAWATAGGGAERVGRLFNRVIDSVIERV
jgi:hypothetical protein